jgi:GAF domain-containing protein
MASQELLTHSVSEFARTLARASAISDVLNDLAEHTTALLGVAGAGVSVLESGHLRFVAASDERCAGLGRAQEAWQAGPGMDACRTGMIVTVADLPGTSRTWDRYQQAAREAGIVAVASTPMCHDGRSVGAVDLYSTAPRDWSADDLGAVGILSDMATGFLVHAQELDRQCRVNEQLREALHSRIVIEQAKGVLAAERHISVDEAFEVLRRHARSHAVSLRSVAEAVVSLGLRP